MILKVHVEVAVLFQIGNINWPASKLIFKVIISYKHYTSWRWNRHHNLLNCPSLNKPTKTFKWSKENSNKQKCFITMIFTNKSNNLRHITNGKQQEKVKPLRRKLNPNLPFHWRWFFNFANSALHVSTAIDGRVESLGLVLRGIVSRAQTEKSGWKKSKQLITKR